MKKDKHILISLTEEEYNQILFISDKEDRTPSAVARRLVIKHLADKVAELSDLNKSELIQPKF